MTSIKEERIRKITNLYYSKPEIQETIFNFSRNREISPRYFEGFGKRPDTFEYINDVMGVVQKGATSLHCSEELWENPLDLVTGMSSKEQDELRIGWDLLLDIDCKWFDYSKLAAQAIVKTLEQHGIKNMGVKFSGSKGFHILIPWKAFPKEINGVPSKDLFPEVPRKLAGYLRYYSEKIMKTMLPEDFEKQFKDVGIKKGIKCKSCNEIVNTSEIAEMYCSFCGIGETRKLEKGNTKIFKCVNCNRPLEKQNAREIHECARCGINSEKNPSNFSEGIENDLYEIMGLDIVLVSPRHLFRMPYSLHEKTSLASAVIEKDKISEFDFKHANPLKVKVNNFMPDSIEGEAKNFVIQALDWAKDNMKEVTNKATGKYSNFKPIKLDSIKEENFPPCVKLILKGLVDGRKRGLFVLINLFRSIGMDQKILEKKLQEWNQRNEVPLKQGYITSQLSWAYKRKPIMPQNCKDFYQGLGVCVPDGVCARIKNPVNYVVRKDFLEKSQKKFIKKKSVKKKVAKKKIVKKRKFDIREK
ncbi:hypothetical protein HOD88_02010 [archaeon]|mgnify:CR=1 FL=1|jgi:hypothetical protein|nr:hypothetical protein [archaeon]